MVKFILLDVNENVYETVAIQDGKIIKKTIKCKYQSFDLRM